MFSVLLLVVLWLAGQSTAAPGPYWLALVLGSIQPLRELAPELARGRLSIDFLMLLAALGAGLIGHPGEGALLLILFNLAELLEERAMERTREGVRALVQKVPPQARRLRGNAIEQVPVRQIQEGDLVEVLAGETIPVDGVVVLGASNVEQAFLTGESLPVFRQAGDAVLAASVNRESTLRIRCTTSPGTFLVDRIVALVAGAQEDQSPSQSFLDRWGSVYALGLLVMSAGWSLSLVVRGMPFWEGVYQGLVLLVVASPCALVLAEPAALLSALSRAARAGILIKGGRHFEKLASADILVLDKTGTLTTGNFILAGWHSPLDETEFLARGAALASQSNHPVARSLLAQARLAGLPIESTPPARNTWGQGVEARVGEKSWRLGQRDFVLGSGALEPHLEELARESLVRGETLVFLGNDETAGFFRLVDELRPEAVESLRELRTLGMNRQVLLSGAHPALVERAAAHANLDVAVGQLLPHQKTDFLQTLGSDRVWMVGDGVNDCPALARAGIGIALGGEAAGAALESSDIIIMTPDLRQLVFLRKLARATRSTVKRNLAFATLAMGTLVLGVVGEKVGLAVGVVGHEGSTLLVVVLGLRLLLFQTR